VRFFDDPGKALQQMEDELLEEDWEEDEDDVDEDGIYNALAHFGII